MCNLYDLDVAPPFLNQYFGLRASALTGAASAGRLIHPSDPAPVIHLDADGEPVCSMMAWGFVRQWKNPAGKPALQRLFNVRSETIHSKSSFAAAYRKTRAIIPVSGYFELPAKGVRVRITRSGGDILAVAGLWEQALHPRTGEEVTAFTMAMTSGNPFTSEYHHRMPCLLAPDSFAAWLDPRRPDGRELLVPYPGEDLVAEPRVASPGAGKQEQQGPRAERPAPSLTGDLFGS